MKKVDSKETKMSRMSNQLRLEKRSVSFIIVSVLLILVMWIVFKRWHSKSILEVASEIEVPENFLSSLYLIPI